MVIIINQERLVKMVKKSDLDKSDMTLLIDEIVAKIDELHDACHDDHLPDSETIKDLTRLTRAIDRLCFTIDNYRYLKQKQHFKR